MTHDLPVLEFSIRRISDSTREIEGIAHVETVDREQEVIQIQAVKKALAWFMELPILTLQHTERPVGLIKKAWVNDADKSLHILGAIKSTPDCDDVWQDVLSRKLNAYSMAGRRTEYTRECMIPPGERTSPCITKAIDIWAITLCGGNKVNPDARLDIVKAFPPDESAPPASAIITGPETASKPTCPRNRMSDTTAVIQEPSPVTTTEATVAPSEQVQKAEPQAAPEVDFAGIFAKALKEQMPELAKAQASTMSDFAKAQSDKIDQKLEEIKKSVSDAFEDRLKKLENQKVRLGPTAFVKADGSAVELSKLEDGGISNLLMFRKAKEV